VSVDPPQSYTRLRDWFNLVTDVDHRGMRFPRPFARRGVATHEHLDALWAQSPVGVFQTDDRGRCISVNPRWSELTGLTAEQGRTEGWAHAIHPDDRERVIVAWMGAATAGAEFSEDFRFERPDGSVVQVRGHARTLRNLRGELLGFLGTVTDLTQQRAAEEARLRSERESRQLLDHMPVGVVKIDADHAWVYANDMVASILGVALGTEPSVVARAYRDAIHPGDRDRIHTRELAAELLAGDHQLEHRILRQDGQTRWISIRTIATHADADDPSSPVVGYQATVADITDRRLAATAVEDSEKRFRALAFGMPVGVAQRDETGRLIFANDQFRALLGLAPDAPIESVGLGHIHEDDRDTIAAAMEATMTTGTAYQHEVRLVQPGGAEPRWVTLRGAQHVDDAGRFAGYLITVVDIHDRRAAEERLSRSEELHRLTMSHLPGAVIGLYDLELRCVLLDGTGLRGIDREDCIGKRLGEFAGQEVADDLEPFMRSAAGGHETIFEYEAPGRDTVSRFHLGPFRNAAGEVDGVLIVAHDITEQRRAEQARQRADEQFRLAFEQAPIGMGVIGMHGRFERVNEAFTDITGYSVAEMCAHAPYTIVADRDKADAQERFRSLLAFEAEHASMEFRMAHKDGHEIWAEGRITLVRDQQGNAHEILMQVQDVSERKHYEQRLKHMAHHDALTGLVNRRGLERELDLQIARVRRYDTGGALLMLDLDGFKSVNDSLGHAVGDALLVGVAGALVERLRETDVIARLGGDEFAVILPGESADQAALVAQALVDSVSAVSEPFHTQRPVTVSIGVVHLDHRITAEEALVRADQAMYSAKQAGRNRIALAGPAPVAG
jgi:diguanylate cyclase (GGDEF)-like protein/PAS domain S-box-containing protein